MGKFKFTKAVTPEFDRMIRCQGHDWTEFTCEGKFVKYANQNRGRFMMKSALDDWCAEIETWKSVETWEYLE